MTYRIKNSDELLRKKIDYKMWFKKHIVSICWKNKPNTGCQFLEIEMYWFLRVYSLNDFEGYRALMKAFILSLTITPWFGYPLSELLPDSLTSKVGALKK